MVGHRSTGLPECGPTESSAPEPCFFYRFRYISIVWFCSNFAHIFYSTLPKLLFILLSNFQIFFWKNFGFLWFFCFGAFLLTDSVEILHTPSTCHYAGCLFFPNRNLENFYQCSKICGPILQGGPIKGPLEAPAHHSTYRFEKFKWGALIGLSFSWFVTIFSNESFSNLYNGLTVQICQ